MEYEYEEELAQCPSCGAIIPADALFCPECGAEFEMEEENEDEEQISQSFKDVLLGDSDDQDGDEHKPNRANKLSKLLNRISKFLRFKRNNSETEERSWVDTEEDEDEDLYEEDEWWLDMDEEEDVYTTLDIDDEFDTPLVSGTQGKLSSQSEVGVHQKQNEMAFDNLKKEVERYAGGRLMKFATEINSITAYDFNNKRKFIFMELRDDLILRYVLLFMSQDTTFNEELVTAILDSDENRIRVMVKEKDNSPDYFLLLSHEGDFRLARAKLDEENIFDNLPGGRKWRVLCLKETDTCGNCEPALNVICVTKPQLSEEVNPNIDKELNWWFEKSKKNEQRSEISYIEKVESILEEFGENDEQ